MNTVVNLEAIINDGCFICAGAVANYNEVVSGFCQIDDNAVVALRTEVPKSTKVKSCKIFK